MSGGRLPKPFCNLLRDGYEECAERIGERLHKFRRDQAVIVIENGDVIMRDPDVAERHGVTANVWVGTYDHHSEIELIEDDLIARSRELSALKAAA